MEQEEPDKHLVVFDCNVYLDIASVLGPPFTWAKFDAAVAQLHGIPVPHPDNGAYDSLQAVAVCQSGKLVQDQPLEVWTSAHIDKMVRGKAQDAVTPDELTGRSGFGWTRADADSLVDELIAGITEMTVGGTLGAHYPDGNPPLDHEDGMVYGACRKLASDEPWATVYCVTRDRGFLTAAYDKKLPNHTNVVAPGQFVGAIRATRASCSMRAMKPK